MIVWSEYAKEYAVGGNFLKKIMHLNNGYLFKEENFSNPKINELKRNKITVIDVTAGQEYPEESVFIPRSTSILGSIQLHRRLTE